MSNLFGCLMSWDNKEFGGGVHPSFGGLGVFVMTIDMYVSFLS